MSLVTSLFFAWGFITVLNDILIPHFRNVFDLNYTQSTLIQLLFFSAYFVMSIPSGWVLQKFGYKRGIVVGLAITGVGALLFYPAAVALSYPFFLVAFFVLASGITVLQVSANPFVTKLGDPESASSRLNLTQGFNSLGTTLAPTVGSLLILGAFHFFPFFGHDSTEIISMTPEESSFAVTEWVNEKANERIPKPEYDDIVKDRSGNFWFSTADSIYMLDDKQVWSRYPQGKSPYVKGVTVGILVGTDEDGATVVNFLDDNSLQTFRQDEANMVQLPYIGLGLFLFLLAGIFSFVKLPTIEYENEEKVEGSVFKFPHLISGTVAIFVYVGAEVAIGTFLVLFWELDEIAGMPEHEGGFYVSLYWLCAMIGRFAGAAIQLVIKPNKVLAVAAIAAMALVGITIISSGYLAMWAIIFVGLFNSIMFPTIFSLSIDGLGKQTAKGSSLLIMAIVGGAIIPLLMGMLADSIGIQLAFILTLFCYAYILFFAVRGYKMKRKED